MTNNDENNNPIGNDFCPDPPDPRGPACQTNLAFGRYAAISISQCQCQRGAKDSTLESIKKYSNSLLFVSFQCSFSAKVLGLTILSFKIQSFLKS